MLCQHQHIRRQHVIASPGGVAAHCVRRVRWRAAVPALGRRARPGVVRFEQTAWLQSAVVAVQPDVWLHRNRIARWHGLRDQRGEAHLGLAERPWQRLVQVIHQPGHES